MKFQLVLLCLSNIFGLSNKLGVPPKLLPKYSGPKVFSCINDSSTSFPISFVNDDYCDCADGSDEPGTAACPNGKFFCNNKGHIASFLLSSRVNDGVCDYDICCDGSDEYDSDIKCSDKCSEISKEEKQKELEKRTKHERGLKAREALTKEFLQYKQTLTYELEENKKKLEEIEPKLIQVKEQRDTKQREQDTHEAIKRQSELQAENEKLKHEITNAHGLITKFNEILKTLETEHNPNYHDMAVKRAIEEYKVTVENHLDFFANSTQGVFNKDTKAFDQEDIEPHTDVPNDTFPETDLEKLNNEYNALENESKIKKDRINNIETILNRELPDPGFGSLEDKCFYHEKGKYSYSICFYGEIRQRSEYEDILLGNYEKIEDDTIKFINGYSCWNGPNRSSIIELKCSDKNEIISVNEPEKCVYHFVFETPLVCTKEQLDQLNVSGSNREQELENDEL